MAKQNLIFVLLPNGITTKNQLRLSIYLTPRLDQGATLAAFPDILNWTSLVHKNGLKFQISSGGKNVTVSVNQTVLRPDIWQAIFSSSAFVEAYKVPAFQNRVIASYPARETMAYFKYAYQTIGTGNVPEGDKRNPLIPLLAGLVFRDGSKSTFAEQISEMRVTVWNEQQAFLNKGDVGIAALTGTVNPTVPVPPDGIPTLTSPPATADTHNVVTRFAMFHSMPPAPHRPPLPLPDFQKVLDFHRALTALNSYPALLRALGLVFDVELPGNFCADAPAGGAYGSIQISKVTAGFKWSLTPQFTLPTTSYVRGKTSFSAAPASPPGAVSYLPGDVVNGFLALTPNNFHLLQVDIDGALLKTLTVADNLAFARDSSVVGDTLPALRSGGIGLAASGRALQLLQSMADNLEFDNALTNNGKIRPLQARDLTRGFRIDVWSARNQKWCSLHRRNSVYRFGPSASIKISKDDEEGFLQPTAAQPAADPKRPVDKTAVAAGIPQPGTDLFVHERLVRWDGWSLSCSRPGLALNRSADPHEALTPDPTVNQPVTPFKMTTYFAARAGSLPELRFGERYRVRARAVDLAGNSVPLAADAPSTLILPAGGVQLPYVRFEPVTPPLLILQQPTQNGATLERMVIRTWNTDPSLDQIPTSEVDYRHVAPPRIAERLAEHHGLFDDANGNLKGDANTFNLITTLDKFRFPEKGGVPIVPSALVTVGYLSDPFSRGAAFRDLPGGPGDTNGRIRNNALKYAKLPDVQPRTGSVTFIDFGTAWPARSPFRLGIVDGNVEPQWNSASRLLTVSLPKATFAQVPLSSYLSESDLMLMGLWTWLREYLSAIGLLAMQTASAGMAENYLTDRLALLTRLVLEGGHDMITPSRTLTLIHAVLQPLGQPAFVQLPVIHYPSDPIYASALRNSFTPITAWRSAGSHYAVLLGGLEINGASTSKIDLEGRWLEYTDDPSQPAPTRSWNGSHVETIPLPTTTQGPVYSDASEKRMVAVYVPHVDTLWFSAPIDVLRGVTTPSGVAAPLHRFDDTKHRWVGYTATATSRFQEYFPPGLDFTRSNEPLVVDVPSSARPLAPDLAYVVPTFGWERQESTNIKSSVRFGNGLRVYLNRPWYSSGDSELLGVVLWDGASPDYPTREQYKALFTQWGNDPIWKTGYLPDVPGVGGFPAAVASSTNMILEETTKRFAVAGHEVQFDAQRKLWYCDIEFANSQSYMPFVRLALARYQPHSIHGVELSRVVLADFSQLVPDRSAVISIDPADPRKAQIFVGGIAPQASAPSLIEVTVEQRLPNVISDIGWEVAPSSVVQVTENVPAPQQPYSVLWSGSLVFVKTPPARQFRVVIREYERIPIDAAPSAAGVVNYGERLVYAAIINYDYPTGS
jgi:hypothetical protein